MTGGGHDCENADGNMVAAHERGRQLRSTARISGQVRCCPDKRASELRNSCKLGWLLIVFEYERCN